jgi:predicted extracellular nuclease
VQFLSYEGTFVAVGGPADGQTSTDIGVAEDSNTPIGSSLQLVGSGTTYEDFTWAAPSPATFGAFNAGQSFGSGEPPAPVINEFSASTTGTDVEYIEILGGPSADYSAYVVLEIEGDSNSNEGTIDEVVSLGTTDTAGFYLADLPANALENGTISLLLVKNFTGALGDDLDVDDDGVLDGTPWEALVDAVAVNDGGTEDRTYGVPELGPNYDGVSSFAPGGASRIPDGVDTDTAADWMRNDFDLAGIPGFEGTPVAGEALNTPGAPNVAFVFVPPIVINEIMQNPAAVFDSEGEWFELYNAGTSDVDINGWTIRDDGIDSHVISNGGPLLVPAGGYLVLGNNADSGTNGGAPVGYQYSSFFLSNGDDEVVLEDGSGIEVDRVNYDGGPVFPDPTGASMALTDPALDNNAGENWCESSTPFGAGDKGTPGALNECDTTVEPLAVKIHEVQGSGGSVAITDLVIVEAIVVGDFQGGDQLSGFFIQEEDEDVDGDPLTSEGILVFCGGCATEVAVGDKVQVTGWPEEYFSMSQIDAAGPDGVVTVVSSGNMLPTASAVDLPASGSTTAELTLEPVEGMLVTFSDTLVVSEYFQLARFGQIVLTADARSPQFTDAFEPSVAGYTAFLDDLSTRRIILDDDNNIQNDAIGTPDEPYFWPRSGLSNDNFIRGGDSIVNLTGVLHWSWAGSGGTDAWRLRPVDEAFSYDFTPNLQRPATPDAVGGSFKVASFNVLNYFDTIDDGVFICGPAFNQECRGADSAAELARQRDKIVSAMLAMDADVIGLMELENDEGGAIADLVSGLNAVAGAGAYDYIDTGFIGTDAIKVGLIYKTATAEPYGGYAILDSTVDPTFNDDRNRPVLAQTFTEISTGAKLTVAVNHLKSKGSSCADIGDPDLGDGQANCNLTRTSAATALANWLATDPTGSGDPDFMIIGDLNSYRKEDPIDALKAAGYTDLLDALIGSSAYTYLFDGQLGYLDYAMTNGNLLGQVTGVTPWNINADEIPVFDYNDEFLDSGEASFERESASLPIYEANAFRASDHDPVIAGLDLNAPPVCSTAMPVPEELWPVNHMFVPVSINGVTDPDGDPVTITITSIFQDEPVNGNGDGNTAPDGEGVGTDTAWLRAERAGGGNGRAYHVYFTAADDQYNSCSGEVIVYVPKSQGRYSPRIDDGPLYDSTQP